MSIMRKWCCIEYLHLQEIVKLSTFYWQLLVIPLHAGLGVEKLHAVREWLKMFQHLPSSSHQNLLV
jgi:hypothetical protein